MNTTKKNTFQTTIHQTIFAEDTFLIYIFFQEKLLEYLFDINIFSLHSRLAQVQFIVFTGKRYNKWSE